MCAGLARLPLDGGHKVLLMAENGPDMETPNCWRNEDCCQSGV